MNYVSEVWDLSYAQSELASTTPVLQLFTTVWFIELGNVNAFHIFYLDVGDAMVTRSAAEREIWYWGLVYQLITASPALIWVYIIDYLR